MTRQKRRSEYRWIHDRCRVGVQARYRLKRIVIETRTRYQEVGIYDLHRFGRALFLDGVLQSAQADEHRYHEVLVHPALLAHPNPRRVLIAGGGEGATLREALRHATVERAVMAELDAELVALCRKHMPGWADGAFEDPRAVLALGDARKLIERNRAEFDVCLCDLTDPNSEGISMLLFTVEFFKAVRRCLRKPGILVTHAGAVAEANCGMFLALAGTLRRVFKNVRGYWARIPSFREPWGFFCASDELDPARLTAGRVRSLLADRGIGTLKYYGSARHAGLFKLPGTLSTRIRKKASSDAHPFVLE